MSKSHDERMAIEAMRALAQRSPQQQDSTASKRLLSVESSIAALSEFVTRQGAVVVADCPSAVENSAKHDPAVESMAIDLWSR